MAKVRVGVSGWSYREWRGDFYPPDLVRGDELRFAAHRFETIEINGTFYSLTNPSTCRQWHQSAPSGFKYAVKGSRYITHTKRLRDVRSALANFFASGVLELADKLGPFLWQLPADLGFDQDRLEAFLHLLPADTTEAVTLARDHDDRVTDPSFGDGARHRMRHVLEFRNEGFMTPDMARIAQKHGTALCFSHSREWPYIEEVTAGFVYLRLHGYQELYVSSYGEEALRRWAARIRAWHSGDLPVDSARISDLDPPKRKGRDVYIFFDNTARAHAPRDANLLRSLIGSA